MFSSHTLKLLLIVAVVAHASKRPGRKPGRRPRKLQDFNGSNDAQNQLLKLQDSEVTCSAHSLINRDVIAVLLAWYKMAIRKLVEKQRTKILQLLVLVLGKVSKVTLLLEFLD